MRLSLFLLKENYYMCVSRHCKTYNGEGKEEFEQCKLLMKTNLKVPEAILRLVWKKCCRRLKMLVLIGETLNFTLVKKLLKNFDKTAKRLDYFFKVVINKHSKVAQDTDLQHFWSGSKKTRRSEETFRPRGFSYVENLEINNSLKRVFLTK